MDFKIDHKNLEKQIINEIEEFEKVLEDKVKEISSKEECLECLKKLRMEYLANSVIKDYEVVQKELNAFEKAYPLIRKRAIELGADVSNYPVNISEDKE